MYIKIKTITEQIKFSLSSLSLSNPGAAADIWSDLLISTHTHTHTHTHTQVLEPAGQHRNVMISDRTKQQNNIFIVRPQRLNHIPPKINSVWFKSPHTFGSSTAITTDHFHTRTSLIQPRLQLLGDRSVYHKLRTTPIKIFTLTRNPVTWVFISHLIFFLQQQIFSSNKLWQTGCRQTVAD